MKARIVGLGQWFPKNIRSNDAWSEAFKERYNTKQGDRTLVDVDAANAQDIAKQIVSRYLQQEANDPFLGSVSRHLVSDDTSAADAEFYAGKNALYDAGILAENVDAIMSWSLVPDRFMPSTVCEVASKLGAKNSFACTLDAACASPVVQLSIAAGMIESGRYKSILLTQSHLASRVFSLEHPASPTVGDGATAMLLIADQRGGVETSHIVTHGEHHKAVIWCRDKDPELDTPWYCAGANTFMGSHDSVATKALIRDTVVYAKQTIEELCAKGNFDISEIKTLACVQPRRWVPAAVAESINLPESAAPNTFTKVAHLGGAGAVANLIEAFDTGIIKPNEKIIMYAQGAGFTRGAIALQF